MALIDEGHVPAVEALQRPRGLGRPETAAVAEGGGEIALARAVELGLEAGDRTEVARPAKPMLGISERLQDADRRHALPEQPLQAVEAFDVRLGAQPLHHRFAAHDLDMLVIGEGLVDRGRGVGETGFQASHEGCRVGGSARLIGIGRDVAAVRLPRDELLTVVAISLTTRDAQVAGLEFVHGLAEQADADATRTTIRAGTSESGTK